MDKTALYGLGFLVGFVALVISFVRDLRRKRRGEPIRFLGVGEIGPDDPLYEIAWRNYTTPYLVVFVIVGLLFVVYLWLAAKWFFFR